MYKPLTVNPTMVKTLLRISSATKEVYYSLFLFQEKKKVDEVINYS